ncbi:protein adenylyltransferase SelO family protein [Arcobacter sp. 15-2]|uniref:protein adenylyltransferase SelO n=1 Tax=Arcobacter sp. 15-2 TaxID=3374109 RepID=UPI00399C749E
MNNTKQNTPTIKTLNDLAPFANYSLMDTLTSDPNATQDGIDHNPRQVFSGHFVPVNPTPIDEPVYITHSKNLFQELGFDDSLAHSPDFMAMFSGDTSNLPEPMSKVGWATGYALSIYGTEYYAQCPFQTGNGYGDGRAVSVFEGVLNDKRWEMQLKGGGRTPYCRGADGRAVLRSSVREFLAQEHMYALGISTSRSLSLYTSKTEFVKRPWYSHNSHSFDPDMMVNESVAISTRVAPSFLRVGQIELFARRARKNEHPKAMSELKQIVSHLIEREYSEEIDTNLPFADQVILLAKEFRSRLTKLVANWIRVGFCQGNFNSDNCAAGGYTLDFGPFGFMDLFDPYYQSWTGGGNHFAFFNQPNAAEKNFQQFYSALQNLLSSSQTHLQELHKIRADFSLVMEDEMKKMWASKLGLESFDEELYDELEILMVQTGVDYTVFFRELSNIPENITSFEKSFYNLNYEESIKKRWQEWLTKWRSLLNSSNISQISTQMKLTNPKYTLREWFLVPAYEAAKKGDYSLVKELQEIMNDPYSEQSQEVEDKYYRLKPKEFFEVGGISHVSCSS